MTHIQSFGKEFWINDPTKTNKHTQENSYFNFEFYREYFETFSEIICIFWQASASITFFLLNLIR